MNPVCINIDNIISVICCSSSTIRQKACSFSVRLQLFSLAAISWCLSQYILLCALRFFYERTIALNPWHSESYYGLSVNI